LEKKVYSTRANEGGRKSRRTQIPKNRRRNLSNNDRIESKIIAVYVLAGRLFNSESNFPQCLTISEKRKSEIYGPNANGVIKC